MIVCRPQKQDPGYCLGPAPRSSGQGDQKKKKKFAEAPTAEQAKEFISVCKTFFQKNPVDVVGVHCTHGFNRTGFFIVAYLDCVDLVLVLGLGLGLILYCKIWRPLALPYMRELPTTIGGVAMNIFKTRGLRGCGATTRSVAASSYESEDGRRCLCAGWLVA